MGVAPKGADNKDVETAGVSTYEEGVKPQVGLTYEETQYSIRRDSWRRKGRKFGRDMEIILTKTDDLLSVNR
ncbi:hypothetical protein TRIP_C21047 [Candidatus Zixiibacteriota bacterium]|nr:hypothetical protein TRIP_C21047 [candidate division Zixibacteria bacterium]